MLETARAKVREAGLEDRILLRHGLAEELSPSAFGVESFDHVLFSYSLSMMPDWRGALVAAIEALSGNGRCACGGFRRSEGAGLSGERRTDGVAEAIPRQPQS